MRIRINLQLKKSKKRNDGKCPVYARCVMNGRRIELSTSVYVASPEWYNLRQEIARNTEDIRMLNNCLVKNHVLWVFFSFEIEKCRIKTT